MTEPGCKLEPLATEPLAHDLPLQAALAEQAYQLGHQHRHDGMAPFGDAGYVYWDEGSARLLSTLGVTSPTTGQNWRERLLVVEAYCDALESPDPREVEPEL
jgi:hypothetical protein